MEPTNNPTPMTNPVPEPVQPVQPVSPVDPVAPVAPVNPVMSNISAEPVVSATPSPVINEPIAPVPPVAPEPMIPASPVAPVPPVAPEPIAPVAPVITPGAPNPLASSAILDTSPITMPEAPKAPDPVEVELNAPLTPAAPVPGSIGSAVSMPPADGQQRTPSVAFTDPATQENPMLNTTAAPSKPGKKPLPKNTLILLCIVGVLAVVVLGVILFTMMK